AGDVEGDQRRADQDRVAGTGVQRGDGALVRRGQLDHGLGRLYLRERLIEADGVAGFDHPLDDFCLGEALTEVGKTEFGDHCLASSAALRLFGRSSTRSTASRMRSRSGRWNFSSLAGG